MCGLAGFIDFNKKYGEDALVKMTDTLAHRGPDDKGYTVWHNEFAAIGFGHRRLAVIDLSPLGHQPMSYDNGKYRVIFNGEIYNYREVQAELISLGYKFISQSDTEVILAAYAQWGADAVKKFVGMFVIIIYDSIQQKVIIIRDRAGVKPLYYYWKDGLLLFASELKPFHQLPEVKKEIDRNALKLYFKYGYIPAPYAIYRNTHKLRPGHYLTIDLKSKQVDEIKYWDVIDFYKKPKFTLNETEILNETENILRSACEYRMVSDVPVGIFLSGGYDSTLVTALLQKDRTQKLKTFTIGFNDKKFNEADEAKIIAARLGTEHHELYCDLKEAKEIIPTLCEYYDEPFGDTSAIPTILVSRFARERVTVALSADAGDEVFAGYTKYTHLLKMAGYESFFRNGISRNLLKAGARLSGQRKDKILKAHSIFSANSITEKNKILSAHYTERRLKTLINDEPGDLLTAFDNEAVNDFPNILDSLTAIDYTTYLPDDILVKTDRASMSVSLESREPLVDHRIAEWMAQVPAALKIKNGQKKYLLKQIVHKYIPREIMDRPKKGFSVPVYDWLRGDLKNLVDVYLSERKLSEHDLFNKDEVARIVKEFVNGNRSYDIRLWLLLNFQMWYEKWVDHF